MGNKPLTPQPTIDRPAALGELVVSGGAGPVRDLRPVGDRMPQLAIDWRFFG